MGIFCMGVYDDWLKEGVEPSTYGDFLTDEYDDKNNFLVPATPTGFYVYCILGFAFDMMQDWINKFLNDYFILSCDPTSLDKFWGVSYGLPRPRLPHSNRLLTDEEYRRYLYLRQCQLLTEQDILINMDKCFAFDDNYCYLEQQGDYFHTVDHLNYESIEANGSNLQKNTEDTSANYIIDFEHSETEVLTIQSHLRSSNVDTFNVIMIPYQGWDAEYLEFIEQFISIKGNLQIKEYLV